MKEAALTFLSMCLASRRSLPRVVLSSVENREEAIETVAKLVENNLTLLGATAVEDKLQDGVPDTIAALLRAGIRVWVLTGDKVETAISIAVTCNLFQPAMPVVIIRVSQPTGERVLGGSLGGP